jgi:hypothetical protein
MISRGLIVVALLCLFVGQALASPFLVCMKRLPISGGGSCLACQVVDTRGMTHMSEEDFCGGLRSQRFQYEQDAVKFINRNCDCQ